MDNKEQVRTKILKVKESLGEVLKVASEGVRNQQISKYPIFVLSIQPVAIGILLKDNEGDSSSFFVYASTLEELATKGIVAMDKVDQFISIFKDPEKHFCFLIMSEEEAEFIFLPQ